MIKLDFTEKYLEVCEQAAKNLGGIRNSILKGGGNFAGYLGEMALANYLGAKKVKNRSFDLMKGGKRIEVKTKRRTVDPDPSYEGSVAVTSQHQKPDYYAFMSVTYLNKNYNSSEITGIWLCGTISYDRFMRESVLMKKGEIDPSNGFKVLTDMRNIPYSSLNIPKKVTKE